MPNVFDQFDPPKGNVFDQFDAPKPENNPGILDTIKNYGIAFPAALLKGVGKLEAAAGGIAQAPVAGIGSVFSGGVAMLDQGVTGARNWLVPGSAELNTGIQDQAQQAAQYAAESRAENVAKARIKVDDKTSNILDQIALAGVGLENVGRGLVKENTDFEAAHLPELGRQQKNISDAEGFVGNVKAAFNNPLAFTSNLIESLPAMAVGLVGGRVVAKSVLSEMEQAGTQAVTRAAAAGLDATAQNVAAQTAMKAVQEAAIKGASTTGIIAEAGTSAMMSREGVYQQVASMPLDKLADSPRYQEIIAKTGDGLQARQILANELADQVPLLSGMGTGAGTILTNKLFGAKLLGGQGVARDATAESLAGVHKMTARDLGLRTLQDTVEEGIQGIPEDAVQFGATVRADPAQKYDFGGSLAQNMMGGLGMGGAGHGFAYGRERYQDYKDNKPSPPTNQGESNGEVQKDASQAAQEVLTPQGPTAAEKALFTPVSLTSLDRVNEIDKSSADLSVRAAELNDPAKGYGPMFDQERADLATQQQALETERNDLSKDWPKSVAGAPTNFSTEDNVRINANYALIEAGDLVTSHDVDLRKNPTYPTELQPRERDRAASEMQVSGIVQKLDPQRLGLSADAANGAPIVGADGLVESGNARTIALKRVYQVPGQKAEDYKSFLRSNAAQFGLTPEAVDAMAKPVLVRVRTTPVNRAEFARQANASTVAAMAPSEQAKSDANRIDSMEDLSPDDNGDFSNASSRPFIQRFMARLPMTEQAGMVDATGALSTTGYARVSNAVLAKAYGDSPVLARMTESMDDNLRNVSRALLLAAPKVAQMRSAVKDGTRFDADITPDLMMAVEELSKVKGEGGSVSDALAQTDLMGEQRTPEARQLLGFLNDNMRRPRKMADFIGAYMDALDAAGDPKQGSLLGDVQAPAKGDLLTAAEKATQNEVQDNGSKGASPDAKNSAQTGLKPQDAPGGSQGTQANGVGNGSENSANDAGQPGAGWVNFPENTGTLGIPRARMPQVKSDHRGALISFLKGREIDNTQEEVNPEDLKPTQAEFAPAKVEKYQGTTNKAERSVLVSSDNYVLDGHHQWLAHLADGKPVKVIKFGAPITQLLGAVREFPSVGKSEGATAENARDSNVVDFKNAMADLAQIASKHTRVAMVPENTPELMPTLVKLMTAGIKEVGYELRDLIKYVKEALKSDDRFKTFWNKIGNDTYKKAALQAMEAKPDSGDLFNQLSSPGQGGLFDNMNHVAPKVAMIDGRAYDMKRDNFIPLEVSEFMPADVIAQADGYVEKYYKNKATVTLEAQDQARAEELLKPLLESAALDKPVYDQKVIDIAKRTGALGQMIAPLKKMDRAAVKLVGDEKFNLDGMKDLLRSTIVVSNYQQAQQVLDEIAKEFPDVPRLPKNRTGETSLTFGGVSLPLLDPTKVGGYTDVLVNVRMPSGVIAEIQINVPEMLAAKEGRNDDGRGHKLYEAYRDAPKESPLGQEILASMQGFYAAAFRAANSRHPLAYAKKAASVDGSSDLDLGSPAGTSAAPSSDKANTLPSWKTTLSSPPNVSKNSQPGGNLSGNFISSSDVNSVAQKTKKGYSQPNLFGERDGNDTDSATGDQGQGAGSVQTTDGQGATAPVRSGPGGPNINGNGGPDASPTTQREVGQTGPDGVRGQNEDGGGNEQGNRNGDRSGVPAGRDIPTKTGLNYEFGPDDLTYEGSWAKKGAQNVEAVELLNKLTEEGRQATREEQKILARFTGWGAGELANNLFGPKLDKYVKALSDYEKADKAMKSLGRDYLNKGGQYRGSYADNGYYQAVAALRSVGKISNYDMPQRITREELDKAKPDAATRRWIELRDRLKAALKEEQWAEASRSTQYAHYTSKAVVKSMWNAMERMGFKGGSILEPGAGIGIFPGLMSSAMANNSVYTGIEYDGITGAILKQLFPDERILVESFVDSKLPKNFYDVAAGNPPFSGTKILGDPEYAKLALSLHDYFFAKSIDRVKPGGLVMFVTSRYTMDKLSDKARSYMAERADLVGAIRLPQTAFKQNAGTDVVTDVIFLRKKVPGETFAHGQAWMKTAPVSTPEGPALINEYYSAHPEMVLGTHSMTGKMQNTTEPQYTLLPIAGDIEAQFAKAVENLPADIYQAERGSSGEAAKVREIDFNPKAKKEGNYYVSDAGVLMVREGGVGIRADKVAEKDKQMIKDMVPLRDALKQAHYDQLNDGEWEKSLADLQKAYAAFTKKHGPVNQFTSKIVKTTTVDEDTGEKFADEEERRTYGLLKIIEDDPDWTLVAALENVNDDTGAITPSAFLSDRVLGKPAEVTVNTPTDALLSVLNDVGKVDIPTIAQRLSLSPAETIEALGSSIYKDPEGDWVTADEYLSGNVKKKLENARAVAKTDKNFERNVTALEAAQPQAKTPDQINAGLGMNWIPGDVYRQFLRDTAGVSARVEWNARTKQWIVEEQSGGDSMRATADWGISRRHNATYLLERALTGRKVRIEVPATKDTPAHVDSASTEAANAKLLALQNEFQAWLWRDSTRSDMLVREFNDKFNTTVPRSFDGRNLQLPGTSKRWSVFDHVKRGAWRIIQRGNTYLAHAVGSGKTFQMVISAMEQKRLGLIKKPMMVVPNHMLQQFAREWQDLYPAARLMVADENNFHMDNRRRFVSRVALSDLDGVIITQSAFKILDLDPTFKQKMIQEQLDYMRAALTEAGGEPDRLHLVQDGTKKNGEAKYKLEGGGKSKDPRIKQIEKQIENMEQKLMAATSSVGKDQNARFDELGVDMLYVDEAHNYRKLDFVTNREVKGITPASSGMAFDLYMKSRYLEEKTPGRSLVMASGTPVTNTVAELYTVQKFMDRQALIDRGIEDFDSWAAMFGREKTALEPNAAGKYEPVTRFTKFVNVPELTQMFREFADVLNSDHLAALLGDKRPKVEGGSRNIIVTPKTEAYAEFQGVLEARVKASKEWKPSKDEPNNPDPIIRIIGDGRLAAIDMRFMNPTIPSDPDSKLNRLADDVIRTYKETADIEYTDKQGKAEPNKGAAMMVFSDLGFGAGVAESRGFNARAWFEKRLRDGGVNMGQVAFMSDYKKSSNKAKLFKDVNAGRIRILVGSSKNMGTGVNAQQRLKALFHLDSPWYPADLEQREGRIVRQGNKNPLVKLFAYAAKGTYDENMWKMLASKQYFIDQALSGDPNLREIEDLDSMSQYDLAAAMVADDPRVLQLAGAMADIEKMQRLYQAHEQQRYGFRQKYREAQATVDWANTKMPKAIANAGKVIDLSGDKFTAKAGGKDFTVRADWAQALIDKYKDLASHGTMQAQTVGSISGFNVAFNAKMMAGNYMSWLVLETPEPVSLATDPNTNLVGMTMRATNALAGLAAYPAKLRDRISEARAQMDALLGRLETPFPMAEMLANKIREAQAIEADIQRGAAQTEEDKRNAFFDSLSDEDMAAGAGLGMVGEMVLSRGTGGGMDISELAGLAVRIQQRMPNMPKVHVYASPMDLPEKAQALRDYIEKQGAMLDAEGALHEGELYLFASGLTGALRAEHVLAEHEAAHFGLRAILGGSLTGVMRAIFNNNASVRAAAAELQKRGKLSDVEATEEVIVDIPSSQLIKLQGWRKVVVKARDWLADHGFENMADKLSGWLDGKLSDQQRADLFVANLVRSARIHMKGKNSNDPNIAGGTMLSGTLAEDIAKQEKWLSTEARSRGYKDIDQLAEKNYPLFEKLAELWRKKNPAENGVLLSRAAEDAYAKAVRLWQTTLGANPKPGTNVDMPMPTVYKRMDLKPSKLSLPALYLQGIAGKHQDLPANVLTDLPQLLSEPVVVYPFAGGYRVIIDAQTAKGEPIAVGLSMDGRIQTITPIHNTTTESGAAVVAGQLNEALAKSEIKVYARNKEALVKTRAARGIGLEASKNQHAVPSVQAGSAMIALPGSSRDKAIVLYRDLVVNKLGDFGPGIRLSRATPQGTAAERADKIIKTNAATAKPIDAAARMLTRITGVERLTKAMYSKAGYLLNRYTPETIKAGMVSDYGVPEAVIDQRAMMQGRQRVQLRQAGSLIDKLSTLTRAESQVAYEWMNETDPHTIYTMMQNLPDESVKVLMEVQTMIDSLSKEAVRMGQLSQDAYDRNKFAYLRRSYAKYTLAQTESEKKGRARVISILGDQYKNRGLNEAATMEQIKNSAPEWWARKLVEGKADKGLKGEKFVRLERHAPAGQGTAALPGMDGKEQGKLKEIHYYPAGLALPAKYKEWTQAGTFEVTDTKGGKVLLWRDFTKDERENMGEIDEARFAIAKTLHAMIHDVEVGRYLEWLARSYAKQEGETIPGTVVDASERYADTFKPGEWVKVPDSKIQGTAVLKYGTLAGRYVPGPVWNDLRQTVNGQFKPFGETYAKILSLWKTSKTALSPAVHMNNVMSNFVMADWHDVTAGHTAKALRIILGAHSLDGKGALGTAGNKIAGSAGLADRTAAREVMNRYLDSGGNIGSWATNEVATKQIEPLLAAMEAELAATNGNSVQAQVGVMSALQHVLHMRFPSAFESLKGSKPGKVVGTEASTMLELYQHEDEVFRLASWLKSKEEGRTDMEAGKIARRSFMDYNINAPWVQALRNSALPFVSYTYRAVPMMLETAANKPHKLLKLMAIAGALNALGVLLAGGDDDKDRRLLPEEKAGRIWGLVPKLIRMPWNDKNNSPVYLDIRRFIPIGDVLDVGANHSAIPILPSMQPGGPLMMLGEIVLNKTGFTGKAITLDTDTPLQQTAKIMDYLYKSFMPNVIGIPGTYATTGVYNAIKGKTDAFGREQSTAQAMASAFGVKLGSYPADVLRKNEFGKAQGMMMEIDKNISGLKRQLQNHSIDNEEFQESLKTELEKKRKIQADLAKRLGG